MNALRIGLIIPSSNTTMEPEFYLMTGELNVTIHSSRIFLEKVDVESLHMMNKDIIRAVKELKSADVDIIVFGCTSGSLLEGVNYDKKIQKMITAETDLPVVVVSTAVVQCLKYLKARKIFVLTPYIDSINDLELQFFESSGFDITGIYGLDIINNLEIGRISQNIVKAKAKSVFRNSDALFISCTNLSTINIIRELEETLGCPVISSNSAAFWMSLKLCNIIKTQSLKTFGSIFANN